VSVCVGVFQRFKLSLVLAEYCLSLLLLYAYCCRRSPAFLQVDTENSKGQGDGSCRLMCCTLHVKSTLLPLLCIAVPTTAGRRCCRGCTAVVRLPRVSDPGWRTTTIAVTVVHLPRVSDRGWHTKILHSQHSTPMIGKIENRLDDVANLTLLQVTSTLFRPRSVRPAMIPLDATHDMFTIRPRLTHALRCKRRLFAAKGAGKNSTPG